MPRIIRLLPLLLAASGALLAAPAQAEGSAVAILPLWHVREAPPELRTLETELRDIARGLPGVQLQSEAQTASHLEAVRALGVDCGQAATSCLVQVGQLAGVARVVSGQAVRTPDGWFLKLRLVDVVGGAELRNAEGAVRDAARAQDLEARVVELLAPTRYTGRLVVTSTPAGGRVLVDGELKGNAPVTLTVAAGERLVRVEKEGLPVWQQLVDVPFRGERPVAATLDDATSTTPGLEARRRYSVLVLDPVDNGAGDPPARTVSSLVGVELARIDAFDVMTGADVSQLLALEEERQKLGCQTSSCLAEIAGAMGAELVVFGDIAVLGGVAVVNLSLFDSEAAKALGRVSIQNEERGRLAEQLASGARELVAPFLEAEGVEAGAAEVTLTTSSTPEDAPAVPVLPWAVAGAGAAVFAVGGIAAALPGIPYVSFWSLWSEDSAALYGSGSDVQLSFDEEEQLDELHFLQQSYEDNGGAPVLVGGLLVAAAGATIMSAGVVWALLAGAE
jgi:hypothetical protein